MSIKQFLVFADDLTGALEVGAKFAEGEIGCSVIIRQEEFGGQLQAAPVIIVDTETRHLKPEEARTCIFDLLRRGKDIGFQQFYKKTDSTLRGNIAAEIEALMECIPDSPLLYAPAYPAMGRTVRSGVLHVGGVPVAETHFAQDLLNPVHESNILRLLSEECALPVYSVKADELDFASGRGIYVCDGVTDLDIIVAAKRFTEFKKIRLAAGPSAFLGELASRFDLPRSPPARPPKIKRCLTVNGSLNQISAQQIKYASEHGFRIATPEEIRTTSSATEWVILDLHANFDSPASHGEQVSRIVSQLLTVSPFDGLIVFGGDTAFSILAAIGLPELQPISEILKGVPVSAIRCDRAGLTCEGNPYLITKSGGFGPIEILPQIRNKLDRN